MQKLLLVGFCLILQTYKILKPRLSLKLFQTFFFYYLFSFFLNYSKFNKHRKYLIKKFQIFYRFYSRIII